MRPPKGSRARKSNPKVPIAEFSSARQPASRCRLCLLKPEIREEVDAALRQREDYTSFVAFSTVLAWLREVHDLEITRNMLAYHRDERHHHRDARAEAETA